MALLIQELDLMFSKNGLSLATYNLRPSITSSSITRNKLIIEELSYDRITLQEQANKMYQTLNNKQRRIYDSIMTNIQNNTIFLYFVSGISAPYIQCMKIYTFLNI